MTAARKSKLGRPSRSRRGEPRRDAHAAASAGAFGRGIARLLRVNAKTGSRVVSTLAVGLASGAVLIVLSLVSNNVLGDSISAIVLLIAFYYGLTSLFGIGGVFS